MGEVFFWIFTLSFSIAGEGQAGGVQGDWVLAAGEVHGNVFRAADAVQ